MREIVLLGSLGNGKTSLFNLLFSPIQPHSMMTRSQSGGGSSRSKPKTRVQQQQQERVSIEREFEIKSHSWEQRWAALNYASHWIDVKKGALLDEIKDELEKMKKKKVTYQGGFPAYIREKYGLTLKQVREYLKKYYDFTAAGGKCDGEDVVVPSEWEGLSDEEIAVKIQEVLTTTTSFEDYLSNNPDALAKKRAENEKALLAFQRSSKNVDEENADAADGGENEQEDLVIVDDDGKQQQSTENISGSDEDIKEALTEIKRMNISSPGQDMAVAQKLLDVLNKFGEKKLAGIVDSQFDRLGLAGRTLIRNQLFPHVPVKMLSLQSLGLPQLRELEEMLVQQQEVDWTNYINVPQFVKNGLMEGNLMEVLEFLDGEFEMLGRQRSASIGASVEATAAEGMAQVLDGMRSVSLDPHNLEMEDSVSREIVANKEGLGKRALPAREHEGKYCKFGGKWCLSDGRGWKEVAAEVADELEE